MIRCDQEPGGLQDHVGEGRNGSPVELRPEAEVGGTWSTTCENSLKLTDQALIKTKEQEAAAGNTPKILKGAQA